MVEREAQQAATRRYLAEVGARCPVCRYDLTGAGDDRCPECGTAIRVGIVTRSGGADPLWWSGLLGSLLALVMIMRIAATLFQRVVDAFATPWLVEAVQAGFRSKSELPDWSTLFGLTFGAVLILLWLGWMLAVRHRFGGFTRRARLLAGLFGAALPMLVLGGFRLSVGG